MNNSKDKMPELRFSEFVDSGEWEEKSLGELFVIGNGRDHKELPSGDFPVYGSGGYMRSVNTFLYDGESVCIGRKGTIDKPLFISGKFWTVDTLFYTHSFKNCLPKFIYLIFQNINWIKHNEAGGIPSLSKTNIESINVNIPRLPEQQKIADCLSSLDDLIAEEGKKYDSLNEHKKGLMQKLFPAKEQTVPELRFSEFAENGEWEDRLISDIGKVITGKTPNTTDQSLWNGDIQFVTPTDMNEQKYQIRTQRTVVGKSDIKILPKKSIMYCCIASIGKIALSVYPCITNQQINSIVPYSLYDNEFLFYALLMKTPYIKAAMANTTLPIINKTDFSKLVLLIPKMLEEQTKIANCLSSLDELINQQTEKIANLMLHKKALMQGLFPTNEE